MRAETHKKSTSRSKNDRVPNLSKSSSPNLDSTKKKSVTIDDRQDSDEGTSTIGNIMNLFNKDATTADGVNLDNSITNS